MRFRVTRQQMEKAAAAIKTRGLVKAERVTLEAAGRYGRVAGGGEWNARHECVFCVRYTGITSCNVCPVGNFCGVLGGVIEYAFVAREDRHMAGVLSRAYARYADVIRAEAKRRCRGEQ